MGLVPARAASQIGGRAGSVSPLAGVGDVPEKTVAMADVLAWLVQTGPEAGATLLAGCALDDGVSTDALPIAGLEWGPGATPLALLLEGGGRKLFKQVANGCVVDGRPGTPLATAIEASRTPAELAERGERRELLRAGVNPDRLGGSVAQRAVLGLIHHIGAGSLPPAEVRRSAYLALRTGEDPEKARAGARLFRQVFELCRNSRIAVPDDCHWRLAWFLRYAGELRDAIAVSEVLHSDQLHDQGARKMLATTRTAALLQLWGITGEPALAQQAARAFKVAWELAPDDEELLTLRPRLKRALEQAGHRN